MVCLLAITITGGKSSAAGTGVCEDCPAGERATCSVVEDGCGKDRCEACDEHAYSEAGWAECQTCPNGEQANKSVAATGCKKCDEGYANRLSWGQNVDGVCFSCPAGTTPNGDSTDCVPCKPGESDLSDRDVMTDPGLLSARNASSAAQEQCRRMRRLAITQTARASSASPANMTTTGTQQPTALSVRLGSILCQLLTLVRRLRTVRTGHAARNVTPVNF
eukprot:SAG22_NODE_1377_length_4550_cov_2.979555_1_plen_220_part_00